MSARMKTDEQVQQVLKLLETEYKPKHPDAIIEAYRYNPASIRVRIVDTDFEGKSIVQRERQVQPLLDRLDEEVSRNVTMLLLITPQEEKSSLINLEFVSPSQ